MNNNTQPKADSAEIKRALSTLVTPGTVVELRALDTRNGIVSGYFTDFEKLAASAVNLSGKCSGVYFTINPVTPDILARSANHVRPFAKYTTADADIIKRKWIPVDLDAARPAGISSNDTEHSYAIERAEQVLSFLLSSGFNQQSIVTADSGNGGHLLICVDLPNNAEGLSLIQKCLQALDLRFSDEHVKVDLTTGNAARIWKLYGTLAAKGDNMAERPHRILLNY